MSTTSLRDEEISYKYLIQCVMMATGYKSSKATGLVDEAIRLQVHARLKALDEKVEGLEITSQEAEDRQLYGLNYGLEQVHQLIQEELKP